MKTKQYLKAMLASLDTSNLDQADSQAGADGVSSDVAAKINSELQNEEQGGTGSVSAFKLRIQDIVDALESEFPE